MLKHVIGCEDTLLEYTSNNREHCNMTCDVLLSSWIVTPQPALGTQPYVVRNQDEGNGETLTAPPREEEKKRVGAVELFSLILSLEMLVTLISVLYTNVYIILWMWEIQKYMD